MTCELLTELKRFSRHDPRGFTLSSGRVSSFYIDCMPVVLQAHYASMAGHALHDELIRACDTLGRIPRPSYIAGVALGGVPLAMAVSLHSLQHGPKLDVAIVRRDGGSKPMVETAGGNDGRVAVVVEDVITTGASVLRAIDALHAASFTVVAVISLVDRLEGGRQAIESRGLYFSSLFTRDDVIGQPSD